MASTYSTQTSLKFHFLVAMSQKDSHSAPGTLIFPDDRQTGYFDEIVIVK